MAFESRSEARIYTPKEGDTLRSIAERETAAGNPITWEELAEYNWGTRDEDEVQGFVRDDLGARLRDADLNHVISADDEPIEPLRIPRKFKRNGLRANRPHVLKISKKAAPKQFLGCCSFPGITFAFDSSFVRPNIADYLKEAEQIVGKHPDARFMIFGHTDRVGSEEYNKKLSERRAWSVQAFILNDPDPWETLYSHPDEKWGLSVVQEILADLGYDPGAIDGDMGPETRSAMRSFLGLPDGASVENDTAFRKQLFLAYMSGKHDIRIGQESFMDPGFMGCGEFNLAEIDDAANEANRRVTLFAFHKDRLPGLPCAFGDTSPCRRQFQSLENRHRPGILCSFYDSIAAECPAEGTRCLEVHLLDSRGYPIPDCPYRVTADGVEIAVGAADDRGIAMLSESVPSLVEIEWAKAEGEDGDYQYRRPYHVDVPAPGTKPGCSMRLQNLGLGSNARRASELVSAVFDLEEELPFKEVATKIDTWHRDGDPTVFEDAAGANDPAEPEAESEAPAEVPPDDDDGCSCLDDDPKS